MQIFRTRFEFIITLIYLQVHMQKSRLDYESDEDNDTNEPSFDFNDAF